MIGMTVDSVFWTLVDSCFKTSCTAKRSQGTGGGIMSLVSHIGSHKILSSCLGIFLINAKLVSYDCCTETHGAPVGSSLLFHPRPHGLHSPCQTGWSC